MNPQVDAMIGQSVQAFQSGNLLGAESILMRILHVYPLTYPALQIMGLVKASQGNHLEAIKYFKRALKIDSSDPTLIFNIAQALISCERAEEAIPYFERFTKLSPNNADGWFNLGRCLSAIARKNEAIKAMDCALKLDPNNSQMMMVKGITLRDLCHFEDAIKVFSTVLALDKGNFAAWLDLGHAQGLLGRHDAALLANRKAIEIAPSDANAWCNQGVYLIALKRYDEALIANEKAIKLSPTHATAWLNKGAILRNFGRYEEALIATDRSIELSPGNAEAWLNMGAIFRDLENYEMSLEVNEKSLELEPNNPQAWFNKGLALGELGKLGEAVTTLNKAIELGATNEYLKGYLINKKMRVADWSSIEAQKNNLFEGLRNNNDLIDPFSLLSLIDDPGLHLNASKQLVESKFPLSDMGIERAKANNKKIRIGYFSSDFREHPVGILIAELIELHNRSTFEVYGFPLKGAKNGDKIQARLLNAFDHFVSFEGLSEKDMICKAKEYKLDIAIDLNGHTEGNRTRIFANRVAPIQLNFLGFPGTMGASYIDYIVADQVIIPSECQEFYAEKVAYLPNSYLMYDTKQNVSSVIPAREDLGLPVEGFVFCGFNNSYKISKEILSSWSNILLAVENSVLWLTENNADFKKNIVNEFSHAGIGQERIIFAPRLEAMEDHLARLKQVDLFLDTWPYNAHSTAMDTLNVGVPLITKIGNSFASRVGASLLSTLALPELITESPEDYESMAINLAKDPVKLAGIKSRLQSEDSRSKLFNTHQFTKDLENLYIQMHQRTKQGLPAEHLHVRA